MDSGRVRGGCSAERADGCCGNTHVYRSRDGLFYTYIYTCIDGDSHDHQYAISHQYAIGHDLSDSNGDSNRNENAPTDQHCHSGAYANPNAFRRHLAQTGKSARVE